MLAVYLDESYSVPRGVMVVGGIVVAQSEAQRLQEAWSRALEDEGLDVVGFADILGGRGRYREWNQDRREALIERFVDLIQAHVWSGLCSVVAFEDIDALTVTTPCRLDDGDKQLFAYQLCGLACIAWASEFIASEQIPRVTVVFETGMKGFGAIRDLARAIADERVVLEWQDKEELPPLQAADFMVSAINRFARPMTGSGAPKWQPHAGRRRLVAREKELNGVWYTRDAIKRVAGLLQPFAGSPALREAYGIIARS